MSEGKKEVVCEGVCVICHKMTDAGRFDTEQELLWCRPCRGKAARKIGEALGEHFFTHHGLDGTAEGELLQFCEQATAHAIKTMFREACLRECDEKSNREAVEILKREAAEMLKRDREHRRRPA